MTKNQNSKQDTFIAVLSEKVGRIEKWVDSTESNHFPSIERRFDKIETKLAYYAGAISVVVTIANIFINKFL